MIYGKQTGFLSGLKTEERRGCLLEYLQQERHLEKSFLMKPKSEQERKFGSLT